METFVKINDWKLLTIFVKSSISDIWQVFEYASDTGLLTIAYL